MHGMEIGGAERALLGFLETIDAEQYDVDLFLMRHAGEFMSAIPEKIHLMPENRWYSDLAVPIVQVIKKGHAGMALARCIGKAKAEVRVRQLGLQSDNGVGLEYSHKYTCPILPQISEKEYDLAISFLTPHYFVANKVRSKKKIAWIHTDYRSFPVDTQSEHGMWSAYDHIISISEDCTRSFCELYPDLMDRIIQIQNVMPVQMIHRQSEMVISREEMPEDSSCRLLTIGRYSYQKNMDNIPDICKRIVDMGCDIKWYIIGYGTEENTIRERIREAGMEEQVILLGKKENPYPYIRKCDIYVQPSRYEGNCVAVREAQMLGKPVVITRYATSSAQLEDGVDGVIVPMENQGCAEGIAALLRDHNRLRLFRENCEQRDYSNRGEIEKLYSLIS